MSGLKVSFIFYTSPVEPPREYTCDTINCEDDVLYIGSDTLTIAWHPYVKEVYVFQSKDGWNEIVYGVYGAHIDLTYVAPPEESDDDVCELIDEISSLKRRVDRLENLENKPIQCDSDVWCKRSITTSSDW